MINPNRSTFSGTARLATYQLQSYSPVVKVCSPGIETTPLVTICTIICYNYPSLFRVTLEHLAQEEKLDYLVLM